MTGLFNQTKRRNKLTFLISVLVLPLMLIACEGEYDTCEAVITLYNEIPVVLNSSGECVLGQNLQCSCDDTTYSGNSCLLLAPDNVAVVNDYYPYVLAGTPITVSGAPGYCPPTVTCASMGIACVGS